MTIDLRRVRPGEPVTHRWANAVVDALSAQSRFSVAFPLELSRDKAGTRLRLTRETVIEVFELTEDLTSGSEAGAKILAYDGASWADAATAPITVADPLGTFEGSAGDRGMALFHPSSGLWIVLQLEC